MATIHDDKGQAFGESNPLVTKISTSDAILPVEIQSRYATTIQTHNAVSVPLSGNSMSPYYDTDGFTEIAGTFVNDAGTTNYVTLIWSNDGVTEHAWDGVLASNTSQKRAYSTQTKSRYVRVQVVNGDATLAHTMSSWIYLKA